MAETPRPAPRSALRRLSGLSDLTPASRLLVVNQAGINLGFYMVLPFLASYLRDDLGLAAATVGLVVGARSLSQQGLFLPSGALVDRFGPWPWIVGGCSLRVVAFGLLALADHVALVVLAVLLVGVAGALFNPAVRTYLALQETERRAEAFAVFEVWGNVGSLAGPVVGALLLGVDFRLACGVAALVFAVLTVAQVVVLPRPAAVADPSPVAAGLRRVVLDRPLLAVVLAASTYLALFNQLYLALPVEAERVTGRVEAIGGLFVVSAVLGILLQVRVTAICRRRWSSTTSATLGLLVMGLAFVPGTLSAALVPTADAGARPAGALLAVVPLVLTVLLLALGIATVTPFVVVLLAERVGDRLIGTAYGWYYLVAAVMTTLVAWVAGLLLDLGGRPGRTLSFALLAAVGLAGAGALGLLQRRGVLGVPAPRADGPAGPA